MKIKLKIINEGEKVKIGNHTLNNGDCLNYVRDCISSNLLIEKPKETNQWYRHIFLESIGSGFKKTERVTMIKWDKYKCKNDLPINVDVPVEDPRGNNE